MPDASAVAGPSPPASLRLRSIALPAEHGGWGLLGEPIVVGLAVAPSWAGAGVAVLALFAFLAHHPLKLAFGDRHRGRRTARSSAAERFALTYSAAAALGLVLAGTGAPGFWWPLAAAAPIALFQLAHDARNQGRALWPELAGAVALGSVAAAEMRAAGEPLVSGLVVSALLAGKGAAAVLYVRARLRCDRGLAFDRAGTMAAHAGLFALAASLAAAGLAPWLPAAAAVLMAGRAWYGLSRFHRRVRPQAVGFGELAWGVGFAAAIVVGCARGW